MLHPVVLRASNCSALGESRSAISVGAACLILNEILRVRRSR